MIRHLSAHGISVLLITHKMNEVMQSDRVSVLRRGRLVASMPTADTTHAALSDDGRPARRDSALWRRGRAGRNVLALEAVRLTRNGRDRLRDVGLRLASGEILGIAGVAGNGQDELFRRDRRRRAAERRRDCHHRHAHERPRRVTWPGSASATCRTTVLRKDWCRISASRHVLGQQWDRRWRTGPFSDLAAIAAAGERAMRTYSIVARGPDTPSGACRAVMPRR